jgi:hypothetical protein
MTLKGFYKYFFKHFNFWVIFSLCLIGNLILSLIFSQKIDFYFISVLTLWNILQFLLIRIGDDYKDRKLDDSLYPQRPIQSKQVTFKALLYLYASLFLVFIVLNFKQLSNHYFWLGIVSFLLLTFIIFKDYFKPNLRKNFLLYNILSSLNIPVIIISTYLLWYSVWPALNLNLLLKHFLVANFGSLLLELVRKADRQSKDGYLQHMSLKMYTILVLGCNLLMAFAVDVIWSLIIIPLLIYSYYLVFFKNWKMFKLLNFFYYVLIYLILLYEIYNRV